MQVEVRLFAMLRERAGVDTVTLDLADGATVADALAAAGEQPGLEEVLRRMPVRVALNREYVEESAAVAAGDELALIPPVSGGAVHARVTGEPLSVDDLVAAVGRPGAGALLVFCGTTRDVDRREYEAYGEMATERIASANPGASRSITSRVASGVTSSGENPVPPVVRMRSQAPESAQ
jgi:molybdopterin synthase catalytic subunit